MNYSTLNGLKNACDGIEFEKNDELIKNCKVCCMGKQHVEPFKSSETRSGQVLELIHSDMCGPSDASLGAAKYILTFIDDFSRKTFIYFLKEKSQLYEKLIEFKIQV